MKVSLYTPSDNVKLAILYLNLLKATSGSCTSLRAQPNEGIEQMTESGLLFF